jgi:tetratricopeptide (TPR) repeat protein
MRVRYFVRLSALLLIGLLATDVRSQPAIGQSTAPAVVPITDETAAAEKLIEQGNQQMDASQYEAAQSSHTQALEIYRKLGDRNGQANALLNLGNAYLSLSQYEKAIGYYQQALPISQQVKNRNGEAKILNSLGLAYSSLSQYEKAISYFQPTLRIFQQVKDRNAEAKALASLDNTYGSLSQYEKAIAFYKQSINIHESIRYSIQELPQESQQAYLKSIVINYTYLSKFLAQQGRTSEAQTVLKLLDPVSPNNPDGIALTPAEQQILANFAK